MKFYAILALGVSLAVVVAVRRVMRQKPEELTVTEWKRMVYGSAASDAACREEQRLRDAIGSGR